ncbi:MAG: hypothetical protein V4660_06665 [Pseudomonadota bacterium]
MKNHPHGQHSFITFLSQRHDEHESKANSGSKDSRYPKDGIMLKQRCEADTRPLADIIIDLNTSA